MTDFIPRDV